MQNLVLGGTALTLMIVALAVNRWPAHLFHRNNDSKTQTVAAFMVISTICYAFVYLYDILKTLTNVVLDGRLFFFRLVVLIISAVCGIIGLAIINDPYIGVNIAISGGSVYIALAICVLLGTRLTIS
ncbi:hypothetical protein Ciccas_011744 [Cichlidogyrus casuarinus]|uniref:Uncharacterized protein n=1 Tax=Cichlidogyrus casuarinus TaxID=1844966 RepID=A0ABD2PQC7_9PLAT